MLIVNSLMFINMLIVQLVSPMKKNAPPGLCIQLPMRRQKLFSHPSMEDNVMGAQGYRENVVT